MGFILHRYALLFAGVWLLVNRGRYGLAGLLSVAATALVVIGAFSVVLVFFPSAAAVAFGWPLLGLIKVLRPRKKLLPDIQSTGAFWQ